MERRTTTDGKFLGPRCVARRRRDVLRGDPRPVNPFSAEPAIPMTDPRTHARFLSYRERHAYFGRGALAKALTFSEYAELDAERVRLLAVPSSAQTAEQRARLAEVLTLMLED